MYLNAVAYALGNLDLVETTGNLDGNYCYIKHSKLLDESTGIAFIGLRTPDIQRIDIKSTSVEVRPSSKTYYIADSVRTKEGVKLGDQLSKVQRIYEKSSIYEPPRRISDGYFTVALRGRNTGYGFILEGHTVVELRAGRLETLGLAGECGR